MRNRLDVSWFVHFCNDNEGIKHVRVILVQTRMLETNNCIKCVNQTITK